MTAVVGRARRRPRRPRPARCSSKVGMTLVSHRRRGQRPAVRHVLPAHGRRRSATIRRRSPPDSFAAALRAGLDGVVARGKAEAGDKTMYDALAPARRRARQARSPRARASAEAPGRGLGRRRRGPRRDHPDARPQGPGQLPRRAQRRPPGPGRHLRGAAAGGRGAGAHGGGDMTSASRPLRRHRRRLPQPGSGDGRGRARRRDAARRRGAHRGGRRPRRRHLRHRRRAHQARPSSRSTAGGGVVVLMDLGSAVLSAELALDLLTTRTHATGSCSARRRSSRGCSSRRSRPPAGPAATRSPPRRAGPSGPRSRT